MAKTKTTTIPQDEGEFTPREAKAAFEATQLWDRPNLAGNTKVNGRALRFVRAVTQEYSDRARPLFLRWRATYFMLTGNSLDRTGPADVHVPEIYKAIETLVPRIEEAVLEKDPWYGIIPRRKEHKESADAAAAYMDWQLDQANVRNLVQPAIRDMLVTQVAVLHCVWDNKVEKDMQVPELTETIDEDGRPHRSLTMRKKDTVTFSGPKVRLVDPFDFIIDTKATNPQDAMYVGHRSYWSAEEIEAMGKQYGWHNLEEVKKLEHGGGGTSEHEADFYSWPRSPTARHGEDENRFDLSDGRPRKIEVAMIYGRLDLEEPGKYEDYRMVVASGSLVLEVMKNPNPRGMRPYATMRANNNGHEFFGVGPFDNAVRLNQHLDRYHAIFLRAAEVAACPLVFAEDDSDLPNSLYDVQAFSVFKGTGKINFTQVPDGSLRSAPMVIGMLQRNIEEVVGSFRLQQGQADASGTATEATLALQEGNRRIRGLIRSVASGFEQLLELIYQYNRYFSVTDVEFPVLGKRAFDLRSTHAMVGPKDFLGDVKFDIHGLRSLHTYGLKATGIQALVNSMMPLIVSNPNAVDQLAMLKEFAREMIGPDEADLMIKMPTPVDKLRSQDVENEALIAGEDVPVDEADNDVEHMQAMGPLVDRAMDPDSKMNKYTRSVVMKHFLTHQTQYENKMAQQAVREERMRQQMPQGGAPEAGGVQNADGSRSSPVAGGLSDALGGAPGQTPNENPGTADPMKYGQAGRVNNTFNQDQNQQL